MDNVTIPREAVEALRENILRNCSFERAMREAIKAWPGMHLIGNIGIHLPLPTQETDA